MRTCSYEVWDAFAGAEVTVPALRHNLAEWRAREAEGAAREAAREAARALGGGSHGVAV